MTTLLMNRTVRAAVCAALAVGAFAGPLRAQMPAPPPQPPATVATPPRPAGSTAPAPAGVAQAVTAAEPVAPPPDYVIGPDDILSVRVWQDEKMSGDVVVRPDGKVSLSLINDIQAAGLTPEQFRSAVVVAATKFVEDPTVNVVIKQINSRRVYVTGEVKKPNAYPLSSRMTVMQMIAMAGGLTEYANKGKVTILRTEGSKTSVLKVPYGDMMNGKKLNQNYELKSGDIVNVAD